MLCHYHLLSVLCTTYSAHMIPLLRFNGCFPFSGEPRLASFHLPSSSVCSGKESLGISGTLLTIVVVLSDVGRRSLRSNSNDMRKLLMPWTHNKLGDRSFSAAGPRLWNNLPPRLWRPGTVLRFLQTISENLAIWGLKCLVTVLNL